MNRMTLLRDIAVFVVRQKIHHFTPGWYHILVGRHVERPCSHAVGTAACFCVIQDHVHHVPRWLRLNASVVTNHQDCSAVATKYGHVDQSVGTHWDVDDMCVLKYVTQGYAHLAPKQVSRAVSVGNRKCFDLVLLQIGSVNRNVEKPSVVEITNVKEFVILVPVAHAH